LGSGDAALLRDVRLRALEEAPYAFSSSYAREAALVPEDSPAAAIVWGMWVEPGVRQRGVGRELLRAVADWARDAGAERLRLALAQDEASRPAAALYRALGFAGTGESEPLESDPSSIAILLSRPLR
jgi:GNAT superfamily N-acetyltransferase